MKTINLKSVTAKSETMTQYIKVLLEDGFKIYTSSDINKLTYFYFVKNNNMGYCQFDYFDYFSFSSVHVGNRDSGTGFNIYTEIVTPTIKHALDTFILKPSWYRGKAPEKYKDLNDYLSKPTNQILELVEIIL